jgi:hypothetical protein
LCGVLIYHGGKLHAVTLLLEFVIDAGMVPAE